MSFSFLTGHENKYVKDRRFPAIKLKYIAWYAICQHVTFIIHLIALTQRKMLRIEAPFSYIGDLTITYGEFHGYRAIGFFLYFLPKPFKIDFNRRAGC